MFQNPLLRPRTPQRIPYGRYVRFFVILETPGPWLREITIFGVNAQTRQGGREVNSVDARCGNETRQRCRWRGKRPHSYGSKACTAVPRRARALHSMGAQKRTASRRPRSRQSGPIGGAWAEHG